MIWFVFIFLEVTRNYYLIEINNSKPDYLKSFMIRGAVSIFHGIIVGVTPDTYLQLLLFQTTTFWIFFDLGLNAVRKKPWYYTGDPKKGSSGWIDYLPIKLYWILKALALIGMIFGIIMRNNYL